jgi:D-3-phosphoglycerate dehydrogenase
LHYRGEVATKDTRLLSAAFAAGLLENALAEPVNIVNAELLLRERGIELVEQSRSEMGAFSSVISAQVETADKTWRAAGTTFGQHMVRLVQLGEYRLEAYLDGILLVFTHRDVPGIIGRIGTVFGQHQVNIAQMSVGRESNHPGGDAIGVLNLDSQPPAAALAEALTHPDILTVTVARLPAADELPAWLGE